MRRTIGLIAILTLLAGAAAWRLASGRAIAAVPEKELYTCPMEEDAEVRSEGPGKCPKCGMDLVPISQTTHKGKKPAAAEHGKSPAEHATPAAVKPQGEGQTLWFCPMDGFTADRPGTCPICNMTLRPVEEEEAELSGVEGYARFRVEPARRQLIGVKVGTVEKRPVKRTIRAVGLIDYNERSLAAVNLKVGGWVEELFVKAAGDTVTKGEPVLALYSPDLLEAQRNYLAARQALAGQAAGTGSSMRQTLEQTVRSARERLLLWDIADDQIADLESKGEPQRRTVLRAKASGIVTERNVVEGTYVQPGTDILKIADLSTVWINAEIYEFEIPLVKAGAPVAVELSATPGETIAGKVSYLYPYLNRETRTVRARLEVPNPDGRLKPGMYATCSIAVDLGEHLVIDDQAILDTGARRMAFVLLGDGWLEPRDVTIGPHADGVVVILDGLEEGERVVTSANFLIDSESRTRAARLKAQATAGHRH